MNNSVRSAAVTVSGIIAIIGCVFSVLGVLFGLLGVLLLSHVTVPAATLPRAVRRPSLLDLATVCTS
jgi:hypothetical protein